jgi:hypothetical protein
MTCGAFFELTEDGPDMDCERERGHEPPHRATRDYRLDGSGSLVVAEWWNGWGNDAGKRWEWQETAPS